MKTVTAITIIMTLLLSCTSPNKKVQISSSIPFYTVTITNKDIRKVQVNASLHLLQDTLWMSQVAFSPLENGYATFVNNLKAIDDNGNSISLSSIGAGVWKVGAPVGSTIRLNYEVTIGHDSVPWSVSGAFARAYVIDDATFFTGRTVFIASKGSETSKMRIHFVLPKGWDIATPYSDLKNVTGTYEVNTLSDLWDNGNLAGRLKKEEITAGRLKIIIAGNLSMQNGVDLFRSTLAKVAISYTTVMGGAPAGKLVVMGSVSPLLGGGETFGKSISLMFNQPPDMVNKSQWAYLLSHEIFHLWNGQAMASLNQSQVEWFVEGFTDYMSYLVDFRMGLITESEFLKQIAKGYDAYSVSAGKISLVEAGEDKGSNYGLIYGGGMSVAAILDEECRRSTNNKYGLFEIMKEMYSKFGVTHKPYTYADIKNVSNNVAGIDLSDFFANYVTGLRILPIKHYLGYEGLDLTQQNGETEVYLDPKASFKSKRLFRSILFR